MSNDASYKAKYDDIDLVYDHDVYDTLRKEGVDDKLAKHVAHLFIRDPLVIFKELLDLDDQESSDHFEVRHIFIYKVSPYSTMMSFFRTFNPQTGKQCVSSHHHQTHLLDGV